MGTGRLHPPGGDHRGPGHLPGKATWYLATNLPRPGGPREADSIHPAADLAEIVRIYGIRHWVEQSYKQVKDELGWADFQVRSDVAIRRVPGSGQLRVQLLLGRLVRRSPAAGCCGSAARARPRREGRRAPPCGPRQRRPGRRRCARSAWLSPWIALQRWRAAWSKAPPPPQLQALISSVGAGCGQHLYIPN